MKRRTFLKITGIGALSIAAGCNTRPDKALFTIVEAPDDMVTGKASWYASTCRECPAGCGILAKNREGRVIKVEGHPYHPINKGALCMRGQASVQAVYHPDRIKIPMLKEKDTFKAISFDQAQQILRVKTAAAANKGSNKVHMMTEVVGENLLAIFSDTMNIWKSGSPVVFEPFAYESLKMANHKVFGLEGLVSYRMDQADLLVSFGADFLETWLSPVEYARKFKAMHAIRNGAKGAFVHVSPFQTMTGANADLWLSCKPGHESTVALGLIREVLASDRQKAIAENLKRELAQATLEFTPEKVIEIAGVSMEQYQNLVRRILDARCPLILGAGAGSSGPAAHAVDISVNYLNVLLDPELSLIDFKRRHRVETASSHQQVVDFFNGLKSRRGDVLLLNNVNPVYAISPEIGVREILNSENLFVVCFSNFMDDTAACADLVFPTSLALESWDEYAGVTGIVSMLQPAMGMFSTSPDMGDVFLKAAESVDRTAENYKDYLYQRIASKGIIKN